MMFSFKQKITPSPLFIGSTVYGVFDDGSRMSDRDFLLMFNSDFVPIMHHFRDNEVFLRTGNDVMVISPLRDVVHNFQ